MMGGAPHRNVRLGGKHVAFLSVAAAPYASDLDRGKRPGSIADYEKFVKLTQSFDVLHMLAPATDDLLLKISSR
jgi:trimethylamine--corrinoid protein Co-methyltransferase